MFSMCPELTPRARIPDSRLPQFMQPWVQVLLTLKLLPLLSKWCKQQCKKQCKKWNSVSSQNSLGTAPKAVRFLLSNTILDDKCVFTVREFEAPCVPNSPDVLGAPVLLYAHCTVNEVYQMYQTWQLLQLCQARSAQDSGTLIWKKSPHYIFWL